MFSYPKLTKFFLISTIIIVNLFKRHNTQIRQFESLNEIIIKIKGKGTQNILNSEYIYRPTEIIVDGDIYSMNEENQINNLEKEENIIKLKWIEKITDCNYMFYNLTNISEIDLSNFDISEVTSMDHMFSNCINVKKIIINNTFSTFKLREMSSMFSYCESLITLDLTGLDTSLVTSMSFLFKYCSSLTSVNLSNFNTSLCSHITSMFEYCISLSSLDISNFKTNNINNMEKLFYNCISLTSLDLSNFNTTNVLLMSLMFGNCSSLISLDISNFNTQIVYTMVGMFYNCSKLVFLNLSNFDISNSISLNSMFYECNNLISLDISNFHIVNTINMNEMFYNCKSLEYLNINNYIEEVNASTIDIFYNVPENLVYCLGNEDNKINTNIIIELKKKKCPINDCSNNRIINQKKYINEKNICVNQCKEDNEYFYQFNNKCYNYCPEGTHLLYYDNNACIVDCPYNNPFERNNECTLHCSASDFFNHLCMISNQTLQVKEYMIKTIMNDIINGLMDSLLLDILNNENKDLIVKEKNEIYQIFYSENIYSRNYNDISTINLGECEKILKQKYNILLDGKLIIFKMEYFIDEFLIPIIEYKIFHPNTKQELDLNDCQNIKININIPVSIEEKYLYKYNPYSDYYNNEYYWNISDFIINNILS